MLFESLDGDVVLVLFHLVYGDLVVLVGLVFQLQLPDALVDGSFVLVELFLQLSVEGEVVVDFLLGKDELLLEVMKALNLGLELEVADGLALTEVVLFFKGGFRC